MQSESSVAQRVQKLRGLVSMRTVSKNDSIHHIDNLAPMIQIKFTLGHFMNLKIRAKEEELYNLVKEIEALRMAHQGEEVPDYEFTNLHGNIKLSEMFGDKSGLFVIHNMGQGCRYCTLWADGINAFLQHLETEFSVFLVSKDDPATQRTFANERGWRFQLASHDGESYAIEQSVEEGEDNYPGISYFVKRDEKIFKKNNATFGPGDAFCSLWHILSLSGRNEEDWFPQFNYWKRPESLDDGGRNVE